MKKFWQKSALIFTAIFFAGCALQNSDNLNGRISREIKTEKLSENSELFEIINSARDAQKKVQLKLEKVAGESPDEFSVKIILENPQRAKIQSVRSFLTFPPENLRGEKIIFPKSSPFNLVAPGENEFDQKAGIAKIGVSSSATEIDRKEIEIAEVFFRRANLNFATIDFHNPGNGGHTEVLGIFRGKIKSLLEIPKSPALLLESEK
jgi:hypothetical protein